jgi:hypothetical protein
MEEKLGSSFLEKRTKKLLSIASGAELALLARLLAAMSKSFLLLFFKKEVLSFSPPRAPPRASL